MGLWTLALVSGAAILAVMVVLWLVSLRLRDASIVDIAWGPIFVLVALLGFFLGDGWEGRRILVLALVGLWGLRLGWHIGKRNAGRGEDPRYARWREENGARWWWKSFFKVFLLQGVVLWVVSLPLQLALAVPGVEAFTVWDAVGELVWAAGFLYEAIADAQLRAFREAPRQAGGVAENEAAGSRIMDTGLWRNSRHPNYFGEAVLWWGFGLIALSVPMGWIGLISPVIMTILLRRVSGVPMAERQMEGRPGWDEYVRRTPPFVPGPRTP